MANDWESLMNSVFGAGGRLSPSALEKGEGKKAKETLADMQKELDALQARQKKPAAAKPATGGEKPAPAAKPAAGRKPAPAAKPAAPAQKPVPAARPAQSGAAPRPAGQDAGLARLQKNSRQLDEVLQKQAEEIAAMGSAMTRELAADGLLKPGEEPAGAAAQRFDGLAEELAGEVLGQQEFVKKLVLAFKRPFVMGTAGEEAANVLLLCGAEGTGRHHALRCIARALAKRGVLPSEGIAWMDLALYPGPAQEKLFLQDLYAALSAPGKILAFDHYEACHPAYLNLLAALVVRGRAELASRYVVQKGVLVEAGTALVPNAVSHLTPRGKFLVFFSHKGQSALADRFGADFVSAVGDVCATGEFEPQSLEALAQKQLGELTQKCGDRLGLVLTAGEGMRELLAAQYSREKGVEPILEYGERLFRALSQYKLEQDPPAGTPAALRAENGRVLAKLGQGEERPLLDLLPGGYTGALEEVRAELDAIVGLDEVKEYVLGLADNVQVQKRRRAMGMKAASLSMHMIYTGNPGTGKTTIARIVAKYLKAIGALRGGQLVEVSRADLVGRYVGHTAPQTNQVIASALGGVLFIDEAYSLYRGKEDSFGLEAIDTLVKGMEDHRDELVVVLAGYSKEMAEFLKANSGLASRFANQIEFPDYSAAELLQITHLQASAKGYRLAEGCNTKLRGYYEKKQAEDPAKNGNGRMARNLLEAAILQQARRLVADPDAKLDELLPEDFVL